MSEQTLGQMIDSLMPSTSNIDSAEMLTDFVLVGRVVKIGEEDPQQRTRFYYADSQGIDWFLRDGLVSNLVRFLDRPIDPVD